MSEPSVFEHPNDKPVGLVAGAGYQIGVRRTLPVSAEQAWEYLISPKGVRLWTGGAIPSRWEAGETFASGEGISGKLVVVKPNAQLRLRWRRDEWDRPSTLQIRLIPNGPDKTTISFHQEQLADAHLRERMKRVWEVALDEIRQHFDPNP